MERNNTLKRIEYWIKARLGKISFIDIEEKRDKIKQKQVFNFF